ncbi:Cyclic Amp-Dependent Transcription Factor Atf-3 [Manis pentadactyla]|nr:Cyclic Amp-Dependent Transcription Factor Atf-3 [Manis pentadactyla]
MRKEAQKTVRLTCAWPWVFETGTKRFQIRDNRSLASSPILESVLCVAVRPLTLDSRQRGVNGKQKGGCGFSAPHSKIKMMLQHPGQVSASEVSASAIVPCLSPPGSLVFEDFANLTPFVKEELRFAIQNKHLCHRMSSALESVTVSGRPLEMSVTKAEVAPEEDERKKRRRERNKIAAAKCRNKKKEKTECLQKESEKLESVNAELKAQIEELKNEKQHLIYMLNLHRPTCIVRAQNGRTPEDERNLFIQQIKEGTLHS